MSVKKLLGGVAAIAVVGGGIFVANLLWFKPFNFDHFQTRVIVEQGLDSPQTMSSLRMLEPWGFTGHNAELDDISLAHDMEQRAKTRENYEILMSYDDADLTEAQRFNKKLMAYNMTRDLAHPEFDYYNYPLTQLYGWHNNFPSFMSGTHSVQDIEEADYYVARLRAARTQFDQFMAQLAKREELGIIPPTYILEKAEKQIVPFVKDDAKDNALYVALKGKLDGLADVDQAEKDRVLADAEDAINTVINPIWRDLQAYVTTLKAKSTTDAGAWKFPEGDKYYKTQLEHFTTTDMSAEEIHALGLTEVVRIQTQMLEIFQAEGYDTSVPFADLINGYADETRHYYPDTAEGREQILADYTAMIEEIDAGIADQFNLKPEAGVEVVRVPEFMEQGAPGGYYNPPALDGSRPGRFYANLYDIKGTPKYGMRALTYHEAVPGHHYQIALQMEQKDLPMFRQFNHYGAYVEGWALYAERVGWELGFMKTNDDKIGALQSELFRAVRLVVDTGIHAKKWTREQAIDYMASNTGMAMSDVVTEIERYIVWPGQATGYKVGQLTMLRLRDKARSALGDRFDIKAFHDLVLKGGALPLTILEERVDEFIAGAS